MSAQLVNYHNYLLGTDKSHFTQYAKATDSPFNQEDLNATHTGNILPNDKDNFIKEGKGNILFLIQKEMICGMSCQKSNMSCFDPF